MPERTDQEQPRRCYQDQEIDYYTKMSHKHQCLRAFKSKDFQNFILHFLCLINNAQNEPRTKESLCKTIVELTGWQAQCISNAIYLLIKAREFKRVKGRDNHFRLNPKLYNRFRHDKFLAYPYTDQEPEYNKQQQVLDVKLGAFSSSSHYYSREIREDDEKNGENEMQIVALKEEVHGLREQVEQTKKQNDEILELLKAMSKKFSPEEQKEIECHLKLIQGGKED